MILKFLDPTARADFLARMEGASIENIRVKPSFVQPTVVLVRARDGISEQTVRAELSRHLDSSVKIFDDVQFEAFG